MNKIAAFVPLKLNSRRLPNKNFLRLGERPLAYHIFHTLAEISSLSKIYCYTSQPQVLSLLPDVVELIMRPSKLDLDDVKANELFRYCVEKIDADILILCHATGPYITADAILKGLAAVESGTFDCAFSVHRVQSYSWYNGRPVNYDPSKIIQTQELQPVLYETSGFYIFHKDNYLKENTRIGKKPYFVEVNIKESIDIDTPEDFSFASFLFDYDPYSNSYSQDSFFIDIAHAGVKKGSIRHISFDLDGVLIDSLGVMEASWTKAMSMTNQNIPFDEYKKNIGIPFDCILNNLGCDPIYNTKVTEIYEQEASSGIEKIKVFTGVFQAISKLKEAGFLISIVTSKSRVRTNEIITTMLRDCQFDVVVSPEDVSKGRGKPNPDPILYACLKLGIDPSKTIYVGDMDADREASRRAGTHFVHAAWGFSKLEDVKDMWFSEINDLVDYLVES